MSAKALDGPLCVVLGGSFEEVFGHRRFCRSCRVQSERIPKPIPLLSFQSFCDKNMACL